MKSFGPTTDDEEEILKYFDLVNLAKVAQDNLERLYKAEFTHSDYYKELVLLLHDNVIEFNFL